MKARARWTRKRRVTRSQPARGARLACADCALRFSAAPRAAASYRDPGPVKLAGYFFDEAGTTTGLTLPQSEVTNFAVNVLSIDMFTADP